LCAVLAACAGPEKPAVFVERANVLPLDLNDNFQFRKQKLFFNDPRAYVPTKSETARFLRLQTNYGAVTPRDLDEITGSYFEFFWRTSDLADVTVRLEYRQAALGNHVIAQERYYPEAKGSYSSKFQVTGDEYLENGRVTAWRVLLIVDGRIVALNESFMWK
jgi:limonene-1,2-epoxide hydrolase